MSTPEQPTDTQRNAVIQPRSERQLSLRQKLSRHLPRSLRKRLLLASALLLPLIMLLAWWALLKSYHTSQEASVRERMQLQVYLLLGAAEVTATGIVLPQVLTEPRYSQQGSGLYAALHQSDGRLMWRSPSSALLADIIQPPPDDMPPPGHPMFDHLEQHQVYRLRFPVIWETLEREYQLMFTVLESDLPTRKAIAEYRHRLTIWLLSVAVLAWGILWVIMSWGLRPLGQLATDLKKLESGERRQLEGRYPTEVQAITDNLNHLLTSEQQQRERYRNTLGDLAHSLKTPLAVIRGAGDEGLSPQQYRQTVEEQVQRMNQIVQYQLSRAVKSHNQTPDTSVAMQGIALRPLLERILGALQKVYRDKNFEVELRVEPELCIAADERDLMELLGNLLENAFKYGDDQVRVSAERLQDELLIEIADNGAGVSPEKRQRILQRGERADTSVQGQGIGLAVAVDILSSYGGGLNIADAPEGGALFQLSLPL
ncbi:MAG: ATP-binding protein [Marinobacterium sp.]|nr:ATP-binding protein [Marinobacterium sp.]